MGIVADVAIGVTGVMAAPVWCGLPGCDMLLKPDIVFMGPLNAELSVTFKFSTIKSMIIHFLIELSLNFYGHRHNLHILRDLMSYLYESFIMEVASDEYNPLE